MKRIVADPTRCVACRACELACALAHAETDDLVEAVSQQDVQPRIFFRSTSGPVVPVQCRHCEDAPCVPSCPEEAISRESTEQPVLLDEEKCVGHGVCIGACPFDAIVLTEDKKVALKCDLCIARCENGQPPACVEACPVFALALVERGDAKYEIDEEACKTCTLCVKACPVEAVTGERKKTHVINQEKCMLCGRCFEACPFSAVKFTCSESVGSGTGPAAAGCGNTP